MAHRYRLKKGGVHFIIQSGLRNTAFFLQRTQKNRRVTPPFNLALDL